MGALVTGDMEKEEIQSAFFSSVFNAKTSAQESHILEVRERVWGKENFPLVEEDLVRERLAKINVHTSMGPNGMHPHVVMELAEGTDELPSVYHLRKVLENKRGA